MSKTAEQKELDDAQKEIERLRKALQDVEDEVLKIRLGEINKSAGFPNNTMGL